MNKFKKAISVAACCFMLGAMASTFLAVDTGAAARLCDGKKAAKGNCGNNGNGVGGH